MKFIFTPSPPSWDNVPPYGLFFLEGIPKDFDYKDYDPKDSAYKDSDYKDSDYKDSDPKD